MHLSARVVLAPGRLSPPARSRCQVNAATTLVAPARIGSIWDLFCIFTAQDTAREPSAQGLDVKIYEGIGRADTTDDAEIPPSHLLAPRVRGGLARALPCPAAPP